ncbi:hypothetical protein M885DRAFT_499648 [Pelagophyceae sp. CCMP2097]|nr:hypothetical protein M885DRAFT_499648 [Pelagophyceae sp. CCMP2097]
MHRNWLQLARDGISLRVFHVVQKLFAPEATRMRALRRVPGGKTEYVLDVPAALLGDFTNLGNYSATAQCDPDDFSSDLAERLAGVMRYKERGAFGFVRVQRFKSCDCGGKFFFAKSGDPETAVAEFGIESGVRGFGAAAGFQEQIGALARPHFNGNAQFTCEACGELAMECEVIDAEHCVMIKIRVELFDQVSTDRAGYGQTNLKARASPKLSQFIYVPVADGRVKQFALFYVVIARLHCGETQFEGHWYSFGIDSDVAAKGDPEAPGWRRFDDEKVEDVAVSYFENMDTETETPYLLWYVQVRGVA